MRRIARIDANQPEIIKAFRALGATVHPTYMVGQGFPDIAVGYRGQNYLIEIKDGNKEPARRKLTKDEKEWHDGWKGKVIIIESVDDVLKLINKAD